MAETTLTVKQIVDLGLWEKVCDYKGWDYYILAEGRIDYDHTVTFDSEFKTTENETELVKMNFSRITVGELEKLLSEIKDKNKVIEVNTNSVHCIDNATSIEEYEGSILIG